MITPNRLAPLPSHTHNQSGREPGYSRRYFRGVVPFHLLIEIYPLVPFPPTVVEGFSDYTRTCLRWTPLTVARTSKHMLWVVPLLLKMQCTAMLYLSHGTNDGQTAMRRVHARKRQSILYMVVDLLAALVACCRNELLAENCAVHSLTAQEPPLSALRLSRISQTGC